MSTRWTTWPAHEWCTPHCPTWLDSKKACPCPPPEEEVQQPAEDAPRLTEAEWRQREASLECGRFGHDWAITETHSGPVGIRCTRPRGSPDYRVTPTTGGAS